jgi:hypothetical protein
MYVLQKEVPVKRDVKTFSLTSKMGFKIMEQERLLASLSSQVTNLYRVLLSWHLFQRNGSLYIEWGEAKSLFLSLNPPRQQTPQLFRQDSKNGSITLKSDMQLTSREH